MSRKLTELTVEVTEDHIRYGEPHDLNRCAFAYALYSAYPNLKYVRAGREQLSFTHERNRYRADQPAEVRRIIENNDEQTDPEDRDYGLAGTYTIDLRRAAVRPLGSTRRGAITRPAVVVKPPVVKPPVTVQVGRPDR